MSWQIDFVTVESQEPVGVVIYDDVSITAEGSMENVVTGMEPDEILEKYDGWSNGISAELRPSYFSRISSGSIPVTTFSIEPSAVIDTSS